MASTELAVRHVVRFNRATWRSPRAEISLILPLPKNTMDPRWLACTNHHTACDCREAELAEELNEVRVELRHILTVLQEELADHATWAYTADNRDDPIAQCKCFGCKIARRIYHSIGGEVITNGSRRGTTR
ncbi:hypothetical protein AB0L53_31950 [Nonomuraea sp. NPDC052129]|uniref:hypothetical protein n=1 Tax=Nonomuraea sp. NPDC052129 TaxID=3154651 RepID=UPI003428C62F